MTFVVWHEKEERVAAPARFINAMFNCPPTDKLSLEAFISHTLNRTQLEDAVLTASLVLLRRLHTLNPHHHAMSGHRLFLAAFMVAHKQLSDSPFSNESWSIVGRPVDGLTHRQINLIEAEMLQFLGWEVIITVEDVLEIEVSFSFLAKLLPARGEEERTEAQVLRFPLLHFFSLKSTTLTDQALSNHLTPPA
ncbi:hypothetical protein BDY24DRAFT_228113, partial [Mrakia frigida]|uniref:cyclin family protein n=1 Tax=Mrakia frigida TaxID=29902 RepID=UPI003FCC1AB1